LCPEFLNVTGDVKTSQQAQQTKPSFIALQRFRHGFMKTTSTSTGSAGNQSRALLAKGFKRMLPVTSNRMFGSTARSKEASSTANSLAQWL